jgi:hypothetical protein
MNQSVMNIVQQKRADGRLNLGFESCTQSITLRTGHQASVLKVERGMAWVTLPGTPSQAPQDLWLQAGETLPLGARQTLWVDGWPHAELSVQTLEYTPVRRIRAVVVRLLARFRRSAASSALPCSAA